MNAQAATVEMALLELIGALLDAMETHDGAISGVEIGGVMTGPDRCTIWGQACLGTPGAFRSLEATAVEIEQATGSATITVTLRAGR